MRARSTGLELAVLGVVLLTGLFALPRPATGDQALFLAGANAMEHGSVYYRDFWDIKQPGIYWFYELARPLGGGIVAVHVLELVWQLVLAVLLQRGGRGLFRRPETAALLPLAVVVVYYASAGAINLTLVEGLVGLPLLACLLLAWRGAREGRPWLFAAAGLIGGVVPVLKAVEGVLLVVIGISALVSLRRSGSGGALRAAGAFAVGAAVPALGVVVWAATHHELGLLVRTTFVYPPQVSRLSGMHSAGEFRAAAKQVLLAGTLLVPLAVVALLPGRGRRLDQMTVTALAWILVAGVVVLVQKPNQYELYLALVPLALLAAAGYERCAEALHTTARGRRLRVPAAALSLVLLLPLLVTLGQAVLPVLRHGFGFSRVERQAIASDVTSEAATQGEADTVRPLLPSGSAVYVLGDPLYMVELGVGQPLELNGWSPEQFIPRQWQEFDREFERTHPRVIFIEDDTKDLLADGSPAANAYLHSHYRVIYSSPSGTPFGGSWWITNLPPGPAAPHADGTHL